MAAMTSDAAAADPPGRMAPALARRRHRVLRAARALVAEQGLEALTMRQLAVEADMSVATLYNLIGGRDEILRALGEYFLEELDEAFVQLRARTPLERARELLTTVIDTVTRELPKPVLLLVLSDAQLYTNLVPSWQPDQALADELGAMVTAGVLTNELSISKIAREVWRMLMAHLRLWAAGSMDEHQLRAAVLYNLDLYLLAMAAPASRKRLLGHARSLQRHLTVSL
jgi:AcrR family transcriptional regulator